MDRKLLDLLVCPATRQPLALLDSARPAGAQRSHRRRRHAQRVDGSAQAGRAARSAGHPRPQDASTASTTASRCCWPRRHRHRPDRRLPAGMSPPHELRCRRRPKSIEADVARALAEDLGSGDVTAALLPDSADSAYLLCKEDAVVCGRPWFDACHRALDPDVRIDWRVAEGDRVANGHGAGNAARAARARWSAPNARRSTSCRRCPAPRPSPRPMSRPYAAPARASSTRARPFPGLRLAQKYAVRVGGGVNHRIGLYDAVMLKENHVRAAGSLTAAIRAARAMHPALPLIVEVETLAQLRRSAARRLRPHPDRRLRCRHAPRRATHGFAAHVGIEVVDQDAVAAFAQRLVAVARAFPLRRSAAAAGASRARARIAAAIEPAARMWFSFSITASNRPMRWFTPPPTRTAYFCARRRPGNGLARVEDRAPGAAHGGDVVGGDGGGARQGLQEIERGAFGADQRAGASLPASPARCPARTRSPSATCQSMRDVRIERAMAGIEPRPPADHRGFLAQQVGAVADVGQQRGGDVAGAQVLGQRARDVGLRSTRRRRRRAAIGGLMPREIRRPGRWRWPLRPAAPGCRRRCGRRACGRG